MKRFYAAKKMILCGLTLLSSTAFGNNQSVLSDCWNHFQTHPGLSFKKVKTVQMNRYGVIETFDRDTLESMFKKNFILNVCAKNNFDFAECLVKIRFDPQNDILDGRILSINNLEMSELEIDKINYQFDVVRQCYESESFRLLQKSSSEYPETLGLRVGGG